MSDHITSHTDNTASEASGLRKGVLRTPDVFMQAIGHMAPAMGTVTSLAFIGSLAGITAPLAYLIAGVACLFVAVTLTQLARKIAGAGGFFSYATHAFGARTGFMTSWAYFLYDPLVTGALFAFAGSVTHDTLLHAYGWAPPWWAFVVAGTAVVGFLSWFAVSLSARVLLIMVSIEAIIFGALALTGAFNPGPGGFSLEPLNPSNADQNGLYLAVIFTILSYTGFESVAPLAEETHDPRRVLPTVILGAVILAIVYYTLEVWGIVMGWGIDDINSFASSSAPIFELAERLWGGLWVLVLIALITSVLALCMSTHSAATRVFFSMGRVGALPGRLAEVHPRHQTPTNAIILQTCLTLASGLGISFLVGPQENFFLVGLMLTLSLILIYSLANVAVIRLYTTRFRSDFNAALHVILPIAGTLMLFWVGYKSIEDLHIFNPQNYLDWAPALVGGWLLLGAVIMLALKLTGRNSWLTHATDRLEHELES
ncbi:APC family permease [Streptomyces sp. NPDC058045]|uniref:APC family permease n=1 Tax=Streptomyces sp. NPDC058045 TaxID=3346311 RepID=UPI0036F1633D